MIVHIPPVFLGLEQFFYKKHQKSSGQETGLGNKVLNDIKLVLNEHE